jgi:hypothetical protein
VSELPTSFFSGNVPQSFDLGASLTTLYTVPQGTISILTSLLVANPTSAPITLAMLVADAAVFGYTVIQPNGLVSLTSRLVMYEGEQILTQATADGLALHINGVEVSS